MLIPTGFWSYSSSDDQNSRGKLSQLRALLAGELQQQIGRTQKVNIFQDVAAIPPGSEWAKQIQDAIEGSSFIIPIITPAFLQSEWCCREIDLFRRKEVALGRSDLVFPIHYLDTDYVDGTEAEDCHDQSILEFLRSRQFMDFRNFRLRNYEHEEVALFLEKLARGICAALRAPGGRLAASQESVQFASAARTNSFAVTKDSVEAATAPPTISSCAAKSSSGENLSIAALSAPSENVSSEGSVISAEALEEAVASAIENFAIPTVDLPFDSSEVATASRGARAWVAVLVFLLLISLCGALYGGISFFAQWKAAQQTQESQVEQPAQEGQVEQPAQGAQVEQPGQGGQVDQPAQDNQDSPAPAPAQNDQLDHQHLANRLDAAGFDQAALLSFQSACGSSCPDDLAQKVREKLQIIASEDQQYRKAANNIGDNEDVYVKGLVNYVKKCQACEFKVFAEQLIANKATEWADLGSSYEHGDPDADIPKNLTLAKHWYRAAADLGSDEARVGLVRLGVRYPLHTRPR